MAIDVFSLGGAKRKLRAEFLEKIVIVLVERCRRGGRKPNIVAQADEIGRANSISQVLQDFGDRPFAYSAAKVLFEVREIFGARLREVEQITFAIA